MSGRALLAVFLSAVLFSVSAAEQYGYSGVNTATSLNVRSGPGAKYPETGRLDYQQKVVFDAGDIRDGWIHVTYETGKNGQSRLAKGWVFSKYLKMRKGASALEGKDGSIGRVEQAKTPRVAVKKFLVIGSNRIGFGPGGAELGGTYYPNGTVFEVKREINNDKGFCIEQRRKEACYSKADFSGRYGSAGVMAEVKWDLANNRPTGLDMEHEVFRKYYHWIILNMAKFFWQSSLVLVGFTLLSFFFVEKPKGRWLAALFLCFLVGGGCQGEHYREFLDKFDRINQAQEKLTLHGAMGFSKWADLNISSSGEYVFGNVFYIPVFIASHIGLFFFVATIAPLLYYFLHFLFVPHPAEKYLRAVGKGRMAPAEAYKRIDDAMYSLEKEGIPAAWRSQNWKKRIDALTKRVKAEDAFMKELIELIKKKRRFD